MMRRRSSFPQHRHGRDDDKEDFFLKIVRTTMMMIFFLNFKDNNFEFRIRKRLTEKKIKIMVIVMHDEYKEKS